MDIRQYEKVAALFAEIEELGKLEKKNRYSVEIEELATIDERGAIVRVIKLSEEAMEEIKKLLRSRREALQAKAAALSLSGLEEGPQFIEL